MIAKLRSSTYRPYLPWTISVKKEIDFFESVKFLRNVNSKDFPFLTLFAQNLVQTKYGLHVTKNLIFFNFAMVKGDKYLNILMPRLIYPHLHIDLKVRFWQVVFQKILSYRSNQIRNVIQAVTYSSQTGV